MSGEGEAPPAARRPNPYPVRLTTAGDGFVAEVPDLPGCMSDGATRQEALENAADAVQAWIEEARLLGRAIPEPSPAPWERSSASSGDKDQADGVLFDRFDPNTMILQTSRVGKWSERSLDVSRFNAVDLVPHLNFSGVSIRLREPQTVTLDPGVSWDEAGRRFWNAVCRVAGQPEPFPDDLSAIGPDAG